MADEETPPDDGEEIDLTELIGKVLDDRGFTTTRAERLDILDGFEDRIKDAFKSSGGSTASNPPAGSSFDQDGFFKKLSEFMDSKASGGTPVTTTTTTTEKSGGWLSRWLGL